MKWCTQRWQPGANNFADLSYLFIYSIFLFLGGWSDTHWQQFVFQLDDNLFSSCHFGVTLCRAQHYVFVIIHCAAAAKRKVIMGYKCMHAWRLPKEFWVQERAQRSQAEKLWQAVLRHPVLAPSHFEQCCRCWTPKASSSAHSQRCTSRCKLSVFAKTQIGNICEYQGKVQIISACISQQNLLAKFSAKILRNASLRKYGEMHRVSRIFDCISTSLSRGEFPAPLQSQSTLHRGEFHRGEFPLQTIVQILKIFAKYC